jgi:glycosyltransferase involved in cell wall biosynthesis
MRLLFVADGRSPTALSWLRYWLETGHEVHVISTYPCEPMAGLASLNILPVAFGRLAGSQAGRSESRSRRSGLVGALRGLFLRLRYYLGPLSLFFYRKQYSSLVDRIQPELVHALRIPFEGMLARSTPVSIPLVISTWGNDLTLHATGSLLMRQMTRATFERADGLISDTKRDIGLAAEWGFPGSRPSLVVPGAGGIRMEAIREAEFSGGKNSLPENLPDVPIVVNPRGQRPGSLRQDVFFQAIPQVLKEIPQALFICPSLSGDAEAEKWVQSLGIEANVWLRPRLAQQAQLWRLLRRSRVFVSPSLHDGTPNSLLEAMACGCFPVVGDIESMREWIRQGVNGFLVDANSPESMALGIIQALGNPALQEAARNENARIIAGRADYRRCMALVEAFYQKLIQLKSLQAGKQ